MPFDVEAGRRYLANLPEFTPTKNLADYKPGTIERLTRQFQRQERAGLPISRAAAYGHVVTPYHPNRKGPPALPRGTTAAQYRGGTLPVSKYTPQAPGAGRTGGGTGAGGILPLRRHRRPPNVPERLDLSDGAEVTVHPGDAGILRQLRFYSGRDYRAVVSGYDCELNVWRSLGVNAGHIRGWGIGPGPGSLLGSFAEEHAETGVSFTSWFLDLVNTTDSDPSQQAWAMSHVCFWQLYAYPSNRHLTPYRRAARRASGVRR